MQSLYLPEQTVTFKSQFEQTINSLNKGVKPYSNDLLFEQKILYVFFHKFNQISKSILCIDGTSELASLILVRSLWELVVDVSYLVIKDDQALWKRYFAFGDLDRVKLKLIATKILIEHGLLNDAIAEIDLIEGLLKKKYVYVTDETRKDGEIILTSILSPEKYDELIQTFQAIKNSNNTVLTQEELQNGIEATLSKIKKMTSWRPDNQGVNGLFDKIRSELEQELRNCNIQVTSLESYHSMLYAVGNAATHSSDTLAYLSYDHDSGSFSKELETKTNAVFSLAIFMAQVMTWALQKKEMMSKEKVTV